MPLNSIWPFKSKISKLRTISKDELGNIDLVLDNKSFRFNEKEIISIALKSDFYSELHQIKNSQRPNLRKWIWNRKWQLFLTFIFLCGLINLFNYHEIFETDYQNNPYKSGYEIIAKQSLRTVEICLLILVLPIYFSLGYFWKLIQRFLIIKFAPFFMQTDIVEIRLHDLTIHFRCTSSIELAEVMKTIKSEEYQIESNEYPTSKSDLVVFRYFNFGDIFHLTILLCFILLFVINSEAPNWWYSIFNFPDELIPSSLHNYGKNYGLDSLKYTSYFQGIEKGFIMLFFDGLISGIGFFLTLTFGVIVLTLLILMVFISFTWPLFILFGLKGKINRKIWIVLFIISLFYCMAFVYIVESNEEIPESRNWMIFNVAILPVIFLVLFLFGIINVFLELINNVITSGFKPLNKSNSIRIEKRNSDYFIKFEEHYISINDLKMNKIRIISEEIPHFKLNHLFKYKFINYNLINELIKGERSLG